MISTAAELLNGLKLPEKYYVGFSRRDPTDSHVLGFATPMDNTKAFEKRKETVDRWRSKEQEPVEIENKPLPGYFFKAIVSRYSTSNKFFRVHDPRGFDLEISTDNMLHLLTTGIVMQGKLMGNYIWARRGAENWLLAEDSEQYRTLIGTAPIGIPVTPKTSDAGKVYRDIAGSELFAFHGLKYAVCMEKRRHYSRYECFRWDYSRGEQKQIGEDHIEASIVLHTKPVYVFFNKPMSDEKEIWSPRLYRSSVKNLIEVADEFPSVPPVLKEVSHDRDYAYSLRTPFHGSGHNVAVWLFDTKKEAEVFAASKVATFDEAECAKYPMSYAEVDEIKLNRSLITAN